MEVVHPAPLGPRRSVKKTELKLALVAAMHFPMIAMDHLSENLKELGKRSHLENINLHRTKCSCLIRGVLSPYYEDKLKEDMANKKFSLMLDESTDISVKKHVLFSVRYFDDSRKCIVDAYLSMHRIPNATGENIFKILEGTLEKYDLRFENMVSVACDGASVMVGQHDSVWTRIRDKNPRIILVKCVYHSLALCGKYAFEKLPSSLGFLIKKVPAFFSKSDLRRSNYEQLFSEMSSVPVPVIDGCSNLPFLSFSRTRWLVRGRIMKRILTHWDTLRTYFIDIQPHCTQNQRFKIKVLIDMLSDPVCKLYFEFTYPFIINLEKANGYFQHDNTEPEALLKELNLYYNTLHARVYNHLGNILHIDNCDYGYVFLSKAEEHKQSLINRARGQLHLQQADPLPAGALQNINTVITNIKTRCQEFLVELDKQMAVRIDSNKKIVSDLSSLSVAKVLNQYERTQFRHLPYLHLIATDKLASVEDQYRRICQHVWSAEPMFQEVDFSRTTSSQFWARVFSYERQNGEFPYRDICEYIYSCFTIALSSAQVERLFSLVSSVKTKYRNRLKTTTLDAIVRVRAFMHQNKICCNSYDIPNEMLERFTSEIYNVSNDDTEDNAMIDINVVSDSSDSD